MSKDETKGWICPKCGRVYAPWVDKCQYCGGSTITYTTPICPCPYPWWTYQDVYANTVSTDSITLNNTSSTATSAILNNEIKS